MRQTPGEYICPNCESSIDICPDENRGKCSQCGELLKIVFVHDSLIKYCMKLGVNAVKIIPAAKISVEQHLSELCKNEKCPGYGMAPSCPPHVMNTNQFQNTLSKYKFGLIFKFEIPTNVLFGNERHEVLHLLHETSSKIKKCALNNGYSNAMAIAAGSCKQIFCEEHKSCPIINRLWQLQVSRNSLSINVRSWNKFL